MKAKLFKYFSVLFLFLATSISCQKKIEEVSFFESGDIVVANSGSRSVLLFNSSGEFKKSLYTFSPTSGQLPYGIAYNDRMEVLMILTDGTADKVLSIKKTDGSINESFILDSNLNSTTANSVRAITQLSTGDIVVGETSAIERFSYDGTRVVSDSASGVWPKTGGTILTTVITQFAPLESGGLVACSNGSDVVRTFDNTMTQVGSVASGIVSTTDVIGCTTNSTGQVFASFNGTTDTIRKYSDLNLSTTEWSYSNTTLLGNPVGLAISKDGTVLAIDGTSNKVVEIRANGSSASLLGGSSADINSMLSTPVSIYVIP